MSSVILAEHIAIISAGQTAKIPASVRKMLQRVTLDAYGLMLSARNADYIQAIQSSCVDYGDTTAFGHGSRFTMQDAVLIQRNSGTRRGFRRHFRGHSCPRIICDHSDYLGDRRTRGSPSR